VFVHLVMRSDNGKTGKIPVSVTEKKSCPPSCPFQGSGCYAESGPLALHWNKVGVSRGDSWENFCTKIEALPEGQIWRHNAAGDLPGEGESLDAEALAMLVQANKGKRGFTFTHKPPTPENISSIRAANDNGFAINLSANNLAQADQYLALNAGPVAVVLPSDAPDGAFRTPAGNQVVVCPAVTEAGEAVGMNCQRCGLCAIPTRKAIIGFPAHGTRKKRVDALVVLQ